MNHPFAHIQFLSPTHKDSESNIMERFLITDYVKHIPDVEKKNSLSLAQSLFITFLVIKAGSSLVSAELFLN